MAPDAARISRPNHPDAPHATPADSRFDNPRRVPASADNPRTTTTATGAPTPMSRIPAA